MFNAAFLPGAVWIAKPGIDTKLFLYAYMVSILLSVIKGDRSTQLGGQVLQTIDHCGGHLFGSTPGKFLEKGETQ
jgi:hypothetical protein